MSDIDDKDKNVHESKDKINWNNRTKNPNKVKLWSPIFEEFLLLFWNKYKWRNAHTYITRVYIYCSFKKSWGCWNGQQEWGVVPWSKHFSVDCSYFPVIPWSSTATLFVLWYIGRNGVLFVAIADLEEGLGWLLNSWRVFKSFVLY